jgi:hypothetical protein
MTQLAPDLFTLRFDDLVEAGRSRLPSLAPAWTDYNLAAADESGERAPSPLSVALISGATRTALPVVLDTTRGFLRTGAVLLDVSAVRDSPARFTLEFHSPAGFVRAPHRHERSQ